MMLYICALLACLITNGSAHSTLHSYLSRNVEWALYQMSGYDRQGCDGGVEGVVEGWEWEVLGGKRGRQQMSIHHRSTTTNSQGTCWQLMSGIRIAGSSANSD